MRVIPAGRTYRAATRGRPKIQPPLPKLTSVDIFCRLRNLGIDPFAVILDMHRCKIVDEPVSETGLLRMPLWIQSQCPPVR